MPGKCWMPSRKAREKWKKGDDLFRNAVLPLQAIIKSLGKNHPEATAFLQDAQDILWTKSLQLTDEDQDIKDDYLAGEHDGNNLDYAN